MQEKYDALDSEGVVDSACEDLQDVLTWISSLDEGEKCAGSSKSINLRCENPDDIRLFASATFDGEDFWSVVAYNYDTRVETYLCADSEFGVRAAFDNSARMLEEGNLWPLAVNEVDGGFVVSKVDDIHAKVFLDKGLDVDWMFDAERTQRFAEHFLDKGDSKWIGSIKNSSLTSYVADVGLASLSKEQTDYLKENVGDRVFNAMREYEQDGM